MRILLTGGSACGKSTYAEALAMRLPGPRTYLATMRPTGPESEGKIARHRAMRGESGFVTLERATDVGDLDIPARGVVLLECMCNLAANEMFDERGRWRDVSEKLLSDVDTLSGKCDALLVVTNDVGADGGGYGAGTLAYVELLGRVNRALAARFDCVYELVCGIPRAIKGVLL